MISIIGLYIIIIGVLYVKLPSMDRDIVENSYKSNVEK